MPTCPQCGTNEPDSAQWCGKCYLPFAPTPSAQGFTAPVMPVATVPAAPAAAVAAPPTVPPQYAAPTPAAPPPMALPPTAPPPYAAPLSQPAPTTAMPLDAGPWAAPSDPPLIDGAPLPLPPPAFGTAAPLQRVGWQTPQGAPVWSPGPVGAPGPEATADGRLLSGRALAVVVVSIALGAIYQGVVKLLERDSHISIQSVLRWNIVLNVLVYAIVGGLVLSQVTPKIRLRWGEGSRLGRIAFGAAFGLTGGGLAVAAVSGASHHLNTDPRAIQMLSGGDPAHVLITILLVCVAAPLVEETLFRGLLLESLRRYALNMAVIVSALFFAVWHLNKQGLIYYTLMGCVFAGLYVKRGLVASMSAHACFNGVLTVAALAIVLGPSHTYAVGGLQVTVPGGWTKEDPESVFAGDSIGPDDALLLDGPEGAGMALIDVGEQSAPFSPAEVEQRIQQNFSSLPLPPGLVYIPGSLREVTLPTVGTAIEIDVTLHASRSQYAFFAYGGHMYVVFVETGDSPKAQSDFTKMLNTLQASSSAVVPPS